MLLSHRTTLVMATYSVRPLSVTMPTTASPAALLTCSSFAKSILEGSNTRRDPTFPLAICMQAEQPMLATNDSCMHYGLCRHAVLRIYQYTNTTSCMSSANNEWARTQELYSCNTLRIAAIMKSSLEHQSQAPLFSFCTHKQTLPTSTVAPQHPPELEFSAQKGLSKALNALTLSSKTCNRP